MVNLKAQIGKKFYIKISKRQELIMKEIQTQRINTYLDALRARCKCEELDEETNVSSGEL